MTSIAEGLKAIQIRHPDKLFIGGHWVAPAADGVIEVVSPMTEEVIFQIAEAREADMDRAVAAARQAFGGRDGLLPYLEAKTVLLNG